MAKVMPDGFKWICTVAIFITSLQRLYKPQ